MDPREGRREVGERGRQLPLPAPIALDGDRHARGACRRKGLACSLHPLHRQFAGHRVQRCSRRTCRHRIEHLRPRFTRCVDHCRGGSEIVARLTDEPRAPPERPTFGARRPQLAVGPVGAQARGQLIHLPHALALDRPLQKVGRFGHRQRLIQIARDVSDRVRAPRTAGRSAQPRSHAASLTK